jgi:site-specific recombinase XerD
MAKKNPLLKGVYKHGSLYWFRTQVDGKRQAFSLGTDDLSKAIREAAKIRSGESGVKIESGLLIEHAVKEFVDYMVSHKHWSLNSGASGSNVLDNFAKWCGKVTPERITMDKIQAWYDDRRMTVTTNTAHSQLMRVSSFFNWARDVKQCVRVNPVVVKNKKTKFLSDTKTLHLDPLTKGVREDFCPRELRDRLIAECPREDLKFVLFCGFHAGLRKEEIVEAVPWWFHLDTRKLELRKTPTIQFKDKEERTIPMTSAFIEFIRGYGLRAPFMLHPENPPRKVINNKRDGWRYRYDFRRPFQEYMEAQGCPWVTPHIMRHTFASLLASKGRSIFKIAMWLGDDVKTVHKHYAKLSPNDMDIELDDDQASMDLNASQAASNSSLS